MKVGLLTTSFPRYAHDIPGNFVLGFARALRSIGDEVEVLAPEPREPRSPLRERAISVRHVPYLRPRGLERTFYGAGVPDNLSRDPLAWLGLAPFCASLTCAAAARRSGWDAIVSHWALPCAISAGVVRGSRPHLAVLHSADVHLLTRLPGRKRLSALIARGASSLWFVSDVQRQRFFELLPVGALRPPSVVCPMGIDDVELPGAAIFGAETRDEFRRRHQLHGFCVLLLGRLVPIKGFDIAIRAAAMGGGVTLLVAGDGPERARWALLARQLGVSVRWLGEQRGHDKQRWLHAADAFALPSRTLPSGRSEGLPCALLEALAAGLPSVASDLPGIREMAATEAQTLRLVRPEDPDALHNAWLALRDADADGNETRHVHVARSVQMRFGWTRVASHLASLLHHN